MRGYDVCYFQCSSSVLSDFVLSVTIPSAVDVRVGDLVLDKAAGKHRDVDVTVTLKEEDGSTRAFKAYEVKREGSLLT